jgi:metacaspase-1
MLNDNLGGNLYPTKENIMKQFVELVKFADDNKDKTVYLFFSYSGHGYYVNDVNGDEKDGRDEVWCPVDCDANGFIVDDDIKKNFVDKLGKHVKAVILSDSCHSGSVFDLRYTYTVNTLNTISEVNNKIKDSECDIILISGCKDVQTSADAYISNTEGKMEYQGAMTCSFLKTFKDKITYKKLINDMKNFLTRNRFTQVPILSSGKKINLSSEFMLCQFD